MPGELDVSRLLTPEELWLEPAELLRDCALLPLDPVEGELLPPDDEPPPPEPPEPGEGE